MITLSSITKSFDKKTIINNLSLTVEKGERISIIGPSGCGKSTVLKLIVGLIQPDMGHVYIHGERMDAQPMEKVYSLRKKVGFMFQSSALFDSMTVSKNVAFPLTESRKDYAEKEIEAIVHEKLSLVGMTGYEDAMPTQLSGGQLKRVGLARALIHSPDIILYDEPTAGLDPRLCHNIEKLIVQLSDTLGVTSIIISHQISTILRTSNKIYYMHEGKLLNPETPPSIRVSSQEPIQYFFEGEFS
jgi:phospholipid/cholesterol/gamma-HCH transport system ATP-binding protein